MVTKDVTIQTQHQIIYDFLNKPFYRIITYSSNKAKVNMVQPGPTDKANYITEKCM